MDESVPDWCYLDVASMTQAMSEHADVAERLHRQRFFMILWYFRGTGIHVVDSVPYKIQAGRMFFVHPGQLHAYRSVLDIAGEVIVFSESFFNLLPSRLANHVKYEIFLRKEDCLYCDMNEVTEHVLWDIMQDMKTELSQYSGSVHRYMMEAYLSQFILHAERLCVWSQEVGRKREGKPYRIYQAFLNLLEREFQKKKSVKWYARELGVTTTLLTKYVRMFTPSQDDGTTPLRIINGKIMREAERLLRYSDFGISQIAETLGFSDSSNFSKFFKSMDEHGRSPLAYRRAGTCDTSSSW